MAAMNFKPADVAARAAAVERRSSGFNPVPRSPYARRSSDQNTDRDAILKEMADSNAKARSAVKPGQTYKAQQIVEGKGMTPTDFGFGLKGAAIPWQTEEVDKPFVERPKPPEYPKPTGTSNPNGVFDRLKINRPRPTGGRNDAIQRRLER